jgi:subtilase family serine protease
VTRTQWEARFSPTAAQVNQARNWLRSQGFTVGQVSKDRLTIAARGTAAQVERAFGTGLGKYRVMGQTVRLASGDMSVPTSLSGVVAGAVGINQYVAKPAIAGNPDLTSGVRNTAATESTSPFPPPPPLDRFPTPPCSNYYAQKNKTLTPPFGNGYPNAVPEVVCGYKPGQMRSAYGVTSAATGTGTTVAIIDAFGSATIRKDAATYFAQNDPGNPFSKATFQQVDALPFDDQSLCDASSWLVEQAIDVEAVHAMAPDAHILYVGAQDCVGGLFNAEQAVIDNGAADVVTNSWSDAAGDLLDDTATHTAFDDLFMLADSTGMTIQFSTGDDGDNFNLAGVSAPAYPSSSPFVTGVGGTTLEVGASGQRVGELGWDTGRSFFCGANVVNLICSPSQQNTWLPASADGASGGYTSYFYTQPNYQRGIVPDTLSERNSPFLGPVRTRVIPDISLDADPGTGYLIGLTETNPDGSVAYNQPRYGGTSLASPLLAGLVADADQASGGVDVGFVNPTLYRLDVTRPSTIRDILPAGKQGNWRNDFASTYISGVKGFMPSFRELYYRGPEVYCDGTGNCARRPETLTVTKGYDGLTGLGSPGTGFIAALAGL